MCEGQNLGREEEGGSPPLATHMVEFANTAPGPIEEVIQSRLVITRQWGYLLFVDTRTETKQKNVSGFDLDPSGRQQGNAGKREEQLSGSGR